MSRRPIVAGNWKMNTTLEEAIELASALRDAIGGVEGVEKVVCPPFISIAAVAEVLAPTDVGVGGQDLHWEAKGAFTGEVSAAMLAGIGRYVIVGHSERRQFFGETDDTVNKKVRAALAGGLTPIVCVGEDLGQNERGETLEVIGRQVRGALEGIASSPSLVVAYEPVWAIGTGRAATAEGANAVIKAIRGMVAEQWDSASADALRIQYGGSVNAANAAELFAQSDIDGALVGGASLKATDFAAVVKAAAL